MTTVLMVTRPILPPWNEGSKNTAWQIAQRARQIHFHLMTTQTADQLPPNSSITWHPIYTNQNFVTMQKFRLLWHLAWNRANVDIYHLLFVPTLISSHLLSHIIHLQHKRSIQTVPSLHVSNLAKEDALALFFADNVVTISDWTANKLQALGVRNVTRINAGVDVDRFKPTTNRESLRRKFGLPSNVPVAVFSGELSRLGSTEILLDVIPLILAKNPDIHFVFACPTRLPEDVIARQNAQRKINHLKLNAFVQFVGDVDDFLGLLNACDMLLFPVSKMVAKIDTPLTILEAMAVGLPVIITDLSPLNEVLKADIGIAVPLGDIEGFVEAVLELASDEKRRCRMGDAGRMVVKTHYNIKTMVQAYEHLYHELA